MLYSFVTFLFAAPTATATKKKAKETLASAYN
jgi:hypothetical protein